MSQQLALRARRANGIPLPRDAAPAHWARRLLRNPWLWVTIGAALIFFGCLWWMYATITRDVPVEGGTMPGINASAIRRAASLAWPTLAAWVVAFVLIDRYRPMRPILWFLALGWGASVSTAASMAINTWAAQRLAIMGDGDPAAGARAAVFVAPFVEEATKATILFLVAMALRYHLVSRLQAVALAGLSGAGFAFTENILYYSRVIVFASSNINAGDPEQALNEIVLLRGLKTAFGHPLFTVLSAIGLIIALRSRSKVVRVIAPVIGYLAAAFAHMVFNFFASVGMDSNMMAITGWIIVLGLVVHLVRQVFTEGRRHRERLGDYVLAGWLPMSVLHAFSRQRTRLACLLISVTHGWRVFAATVRLQRTMTELVYLRDAQLRGVVDAAGDDRARELIAAASAWQPVAITDPDTQKVRWPKIPDSWRRVLRRRRPAPPQQTWGPPSGPPAHLPVAGGQGAVGSPQYSPVNPGWGPPKG